MKIKVEYNGKYPNLCSGHLVVCVDNKKWDFGTFCLSSNGKAYITKEGGEKATKGDWEIKAYPKGFPSKLKQKVLEAVNEEIPHGCCGGCI